MSSLRATPSPARALLVALATIPGLLGPAPRAADSPPRLPTDETATERDARLRWWREARFGLFIHWGPSSLSGTEISWSRVGHPHDHPGLESVPAEVYDRLYERFDPVQFDADAWVRMAKDAGMKYVVFTAKHHDGFSMWPTRLRPDYSIAATPFRRDICKEIADAAHRHGLKLGWYYSTRDWTHPDYLVGDNRRYDDFYRGQVRELITSYGRVDTLWFDHVAGNWRDYRFRDLFEMLYALQPGILVNDRAARFIRGTDDRPAPDLEALVRGDFDTPEQRIGAFQNDRPWESCVTMTHCADGGGWSYRPDGRTRGFEECLRMLVNCACGDGNLLLNVGPLPTGEIAPDQVAVLGRMGRWLAKHGESIYATRGGPYRNGEWGGSTHRGASIYLHVFRFGGEILRLPPLRAKVLRAAALTGGEASVAPAEGSLTIRVARADQDPVDTVVRLDLEAPADGELPDGKPLDVAAPLSFELDSPLDRQVFQRRTLVEGAIRVSGRASKEAERVEARATGTSASGELPGEWRDISRDAGDGSFRGELLLPAGGWYSVEVRASRGGKVDASIRVRRVGVGEVLIVAGQSNSSNHGSERQRPASDLVSSFDGATWRPADDPQPGGSGDGGSFIPAFGDALSSRLGVPVGVASLGVGATSVREWLPRGDRMRQQPTTGAHVRAVGPGEWESTGELFDRLAASLSGLGPRGCRAILWHQGESDAGQARAGYPADRQISGEQYRAFMERLIRASREAAGWDVPWLTARATYHGEADPADEEFREAQASLWKSGLALEGPDTDLLRAEYRDGVHFNAKGLRRHGELWADKVSAAIETAGTRAP